MRTRTYGVVIIGGGAAGIGIAVALKDAGVTDVLILERDTIGGSFEAWPAETRFITPSFATNSIGMLDLNAVAIGTSPAHGLAVEHPTGAEYASHLRSVAKTFKLSVKEHVDVHDIEEDGERFHIETSKKAFRARHVVWAAGEFQYPRTDAFPGSELCRHTATIERYDRLEGEQFVIIGGYESGIDAAYHLARRNKCVRLFDEGCPWKTETSDPSKTLSTYSLERMRDPAFIERVELFPNTPVLGVAHHGTEYETMIDEGAQSFRTTVPPLFAGGFAGSHGLVKHLFDMREDGFPRLTEDDESTLVPRLYLCGPAVRHDNHVFCFIYKFRQRFAVVAKSIATSLGEPAPQLEHYRDWGMYLDDLSCCGQECAC